MFIYRFGFSPSAIRNIIVSTVVKTLLSSKQFHHHPQPMTSIFCEIYVLQMQSLGVSLVDKNHHKDLDTTRKMLYIHHVIGNILDSEVLDRLPY